MPPSNSTSSTPWPEPSKRPRPTPAAPARRRALFSTPLGALLLILAAILSALGCCSPSPTLASPPPLPLGRPPQAEAAEVAEGLRRARVEGGQVTLDAQTVRRLSALVDAWRAYATALERAGRWR